MPYKIQSAMATNTLHRGRLIDHLHLVVRDLTESKTFYTAVLQALDIPLGGEGPDFFWADELFISTAGSRAARGELTGRTHLAFQAKDRATVDRFHASAVAAGGRDNGPPGDARITRATTRHLCWIRPATTSRSCTTVRQSAQPTQ
jgi:catechol 2,3-dioxygenase-like lactoylglutathione lyase family enzyme